MTVTASLFGNLPDLEVAAPAVQAFGSDVFTSFGHPADSEFGSKPGSCLDDLVILGGLTRCFVASCHPLPNVKDVLVGKAEPKELKRTRPWFV